MSAEPTANMNGHQPPVLSEAERNEIMDDLKKTEDEIETLRQVLQARMRHANTLKQKLGLTPWHEIQNDIYTGWRTVRDSEPMHKTEDVLKSTGAVVKTKLSDMRNSDSFKSFESRFGSAISNVKSRLATSVSMYGGLHGDAADGVAQGTPASPSSGNHHASKN